MLKKKKKNWKTKRHNQKSITDALEQAFLYKAVEKPCYFVWILYLRLPAWYYSGCSIMKSNEASREE